jgi:hypothetical protein
MFNTNGKRGYGMADNECRIWLPQFIFQLARSMDWLDSLSDLKPYNLCRTWTGLNTDLIRRQPGSGYSDCMMFRIKYKSWGVNIKMQFWASPIYAILLTVVFIFLVLLSWYKRTKRSRLNINFKHLYASVKARKTRLDTVEQHPYSTWSWCFATHMPAPFTFSYSCFKIYLRPVPKS